uniref:Uncharacterized protein n=1 Tax=Salix viminalis TaxID=40686 RepID=A0A6N2K7I7_SALVM
MNKCSQRRALAVVTNLLSRVNVNYSTLSLGHTDQLPIHCIHLTVDWLLDQNESWLLSFSCRSFVCQRG